MENTKLACIKFATVNSTKEDPYELAITIIDGGTIHEPVFYRFNIEDAEVEQFGGIIPEDGLRTGKTFSEQWSDIKDLFEKQDYLVCYRSGDDFNALNRILKKRSLPYPNALMFDINNVARRTMLSLINYQYLNICEELEIEVEPETSNLSYLSAQILKKCMVISSTSDIESLLACCEITPSKMSSIGYEKGISPKKRKSVEEKDPKASEIKPEPGVSPDPQNFFFEKNVLFTGTFKNWGFDKKTECKQIIANIGGFPQDNLNGFTNVLVEGVQSATKKIDGKFTMSGKQKDARKLKDKGLDIEIISGDVFFDEAFEYIMMKRKKS